MPPLWMRQREMRLVNFSRTVPPMSLEGTLPSDFYITEDKKQSAYASLLLTPFTRFEIYRDRNTPIDQWILGLL